MAGPKYTEEDLRATLADPAWKTPDGKQQIANFVGPDTFATLLKMEHGDVGSAPPGVTPGGHNWLGDIARVAGGTTGMGLAAGLAPETGSLSMLIPAIGMALGTLAGDAGQSIITGDEMTPKMDLASSAIPYAPSAVRGVSRVVGPRVGAGMGALLGAASGHPFIGGTVGGAVGKGVEEGGPAVANVLDRVISAPGSLFKMLMGKEGPAAEAELGSVSKDAVRNAVKGAEGADEGSVVRGATRRVPAPPTATGTGTGGPVPEGPTAPSWDAFIPPKPAPIEAPSVGAAEGAMPTNAQFKGNLATHKSTNESPARSIGDLRRRFQGGKTPTSGKSAKFDETSGAADMLEKMLDDLHGPNRGNMPNGGPDPEAYFPGKDMPDEWGHPREFPELYKSDGVPEVRRKLGSKLDKKK